MSEIPSKPTRRIVVCRGQFCNMDRRADQLLEHLQPLVEAANAEASQADSEAPLTIRITTANCLSMCGGGPNAIIYPGGSIFNRLDEQNLALVIAACQVKR